jgi:glycogen/starch synthases, ADP-glucose type
LSHARILPVKILFAVSEVHPLIKTGGLADVAGTLPAALQVLGHNVHLVLPAYPPAIARCGHGSVITASKGFSTYPRILEGRLPDTDIPCYLVDSPAHFNRPGGPYLDLQGHDWPDNAARFTTFCRSVVDLALNRAHVGWQPEVVHCHDWHTGLIPALLSREPKRPASIFTIHNLAYQGLFSWKVFQSLNLPPDLWHANAMEFYGQFAFIKGGLVFSDWITTVSPTYACEICTPEYGYGLDGLLRSRVDRLVGILNGVDYGVWDPACDPHIVANYSVENLSRKSENTRALRRELGLPMQDGLPLIGQIGRMEEQKGIDLILEVLPELLCAPLQLVMIGTGIKYFEEALRAAAANHPDRLAVHIGFNEALSHRIEAAADMFLMPSRFEPCGLNQIYSLRYGTVPLVRRTGGLADTVVDATQENLANETATGFSFDPPTAEALVATVRRALALYRTSPERWRKLMVTGMTQNFSWQRSVIHYEALYRRAIAAAQT